MGGVSVSVLLLLLHQLYTLTTANTEAPKVKVSVYYETLCPDSQRFIVQQLYPVWRDLKDIIQLDIHSFGKTVEYDGGSRFTCQHGSRECRANTMLTCAKKYIADESQFLDFVKCVMSRFTGTDAGPVCANETRVEFEEIQRCYGGAEGLALQHQLSLHQAALSPSLDYVPWILVNQVFTRHQLRAAQYNLRAVVCATYEGATPAMCF
ncbi:gamma-interferon-inducible lysosomal thiol reductase isoform X1 [Cherax quadricarinatus]|nr:gamma-interferon-inducible lysosomal thiol reductase-like isoform X1 [Cherax quadricarinatus]